MIASSSPPSLSREDLIASLRSTVRRLEQSENSGAVVLLKERLIERIAEIEADSAQEPPGASQ